MDLWTQCGGREWDKWSSISIYTLLCVRWVAGEESLCSSGSPVWHSAMTWRDGMGEERETLEGRDICIIMAISRHMAEANITL